MLNIARGLADCAIMKYFRVELFYPIILITINNHNRSGTQFACKSM